MFKQLPDKLSYPDIEQEILKFWKDNQIFEKTLENRKNAPNYSFYEGPPTVNGKPGIHHVMARTIKDAVCRYKTQKGYFVRRQAGWDTHGLPVELAMEKELGFKDKSEIEVYGIKEFNAKCKEMVFRNIDQDQGWGYLTERMGYWVDLSTAYITCKLEYVESVWWALKKFFEKGLIYRGFKVIPQSPTIATPLSTHELSLGYKEVKDPNCYLQLKITSSKIKELEDAHLLVWTTTPWTLFANVALACGVDYDYVLVENGAKKLVLAESRLSVLDGEYTILKKFKGSDLVGTGYEQILPYCKIDKEKYPEALTVLAGDFVTTGDGSGIVHLAPAFGEDDYQMSLKYKIPFLQPVTPDGLFKDELGEKWAGRTIKAFKYEDGRTTESSDKDIAIELKENDKIYKYSKDYAHNYPHCWRTGNPIMYYARESWFIRSTEYREKMIELNKTINWQPKEIGEGRFGNWLDEVKDWSLSRDRYWGTPLPIWVNENDKEDMLAIGSKEELLDGFYEMEDGSRVPVSKAPVEFDLHRPFVDNVVFVKDGKTYRRTKEVIDVWFDSGAMFFSQFHYPFENKELFEKNFPGDFIAEGVDQTRGWFYTLHNIATALFGKPAFKNIIVNELILDKKGVKMSKSLGNTVDPFDIMNKYGADATRWYLLASTPPWRTTLFNEDDIAKTVIADFFRSLTNTYAFFALYANIDGFDGTEKWIDYSERPEIDKWIMSKFHSLLADYTKYMDDYDLTKACRAVQDFTINELSNWYIRRNRRRFWKGDKDDDKIAAYQTLHHILSWLCDLIAPISPFLAEDLYQRLQFKIDRLQLSYKEYQSSYEKQIINYRNKAVTESGDNMAALHNKCHKQMQKSESLMSGSEQLLRQSGELLDDNDKMFNYVGKKGAKSAKFADISNTVYEISKDIVNIREKLLRRNDEILASIGELDQEQTISVHLCNMPISNNALIDIDLERRMEMAQKIVSLARFLREKSKLRIRQPLRRILIPVNTPTERRDIQQVEEIIKEELNIKAIEFVTDSTSNIISKSAKGNFKTLGKKFGKETQIVANAIKSMTNEQIRELEANKKYTLNGFEFELEDVEIASNDIEGWLVTNDGAVTVALDTTLDADLVKEGIAREFVSRVQNLRKDSGFEVIDRITIDLQCDINTKGALLDKMDYVCNETLCDSIVFEVSLPESHEIEFLDGKIRVKVAKV
ncbi:MAG: isoleucine--tRNA ligase [Ignavibacteria bacterium]|jgi:isoleucyl-tRNA synthetase|nr:isoleucine--tRNA ligase [Ignavibacteria bacterium]